MFIIKDLSREQTYLLTRQLINLLTKTLVNKL